MRICSRPKRKALFMALLLFFFLQEGAMLTWAAGQEREQEGSPQETQSGQEAFLEGLDLEQVQEAVNQLLGEDTFSIRQLLEEALAGEEVFSWERIKGLLGQILLQQLGGDRQVLFQVVLLALVGALFSDLTGVFGSGQAQDMSFYLVYMLLLAILATAFGKLCQGLAENLQNFIVFMQALMPSYFLAVTAATGAATAMVFYEMVLVVIFLIQMVLLKAVLPGIQAYVVLELVNYLHKEDFLSKTGELLRTLIEWGLKTCTGVIIGMQVLQNMITPALDSLKRDMLGKTAAAIPGVGNAINGVTEVALGTAVLIRNCLGVAGILVLLVLGLPPVIQLAITAITYKFLAALMQPVSDKRMVGCISTMGEGCRLLLKVLLTVELLFLITIAILSVSFISH